MPKLTKEQDDNKHKECLDSINALIALQQKKLDLLLKWKRGLA